MAFFKSLKNFFFFIFLFQKFRKNPSYPSYVYTLKYMSKNTHSHGKEKFVLIKTVSAFDSEYGTLYRVWECPICHIKVIEFPKVR